MIRKRGFFVLLSVFQSFWFSAVAQDCADPGNIFTFYYGDIKYELVKENKTWSDAAACAVERGGFLAEINSQEEQDSLFYQVKQAGIDVAQTVAPDGGRASYVWIGGNDLAVEGKWIWDGDNDGTGPQFWQGTRNGSAVDGHFTNWGREPDNYNNQDALGLAITDWPLGTAGQWNDIDPENTLYYLIEFGHPTGICPPIRAESRPRDYALLNNYPNPFNNATIIRYSLEERSRVVLSIHNSRGQQVERLVEEEKEAGTFQVHWSSPESLASGLYWARLWTETGVVSHKILLIK
ncbi:T9SS type A sorting domain-containing protein [candidate division KSB1 bacterium]|nr:T9SS type A sorting domain-containing protein [candidate division KSB1 bacterium]